jgi:SAM-dependent methyltransferase
MWLADQVGDSGHVVGTDIDLRFLSDLEHPRLQVRRHDVLTDEIEPEAYDLVHGRFVLLHLHQHADLVINKLTAALRPGGCILFEEIDFGTIWGADRHNALSAPTREATDWITSFARSLGVQDPEFGRRLPALFRSSGLVDVESWARYDISPPGSDYRRLLGLSIVTGHRAPGSRRGTWLRRPTRQTTPDCARRL